MDYCRRGLCMCLWHDCEQSARANGLLQAWSVHDVFVTWLWTECTSKWTTAGVVCAWCAWLWTECTSKWTTAGVVCAQSARANGLLQAWCVHDVLVTWLWTECTSKWTTAGVVCGRGAPSVQSQCWRTGRWLNTLCSSLFYSYCFIWHSISLERHS